MRGRSAREIVGSKWPNWEASRFVTGGGLRWHVQAAGEGPTLLLLHGAGAATHSWRGLLPLLAARFQVVAPDLPGHGFTDRPSGPLSLPEMAKRLAGLLAASEIRPDLVIGHSAGAAIAIRMALDGTAVPRAIVALNGALAPFGGAAAPLFQGLAKVLFANPVAAAVFAARARDPMQVRRLIEGTGSRLDEQGLALYGRLFRDPRHVGAVLAMMADWHVEPLRRAYGSLKTPLTLVVGDGDRAIPPLVAAQVASLIPSGRIVTLDGLGHLAHEERPDRVADVVFDVARGAGLLAEAAA